MITEEIMIAACKAADEVIKRHLPDIQSAIFLVAVEEVADDTVKVHSSGNMTPAMARSALPAALRMMHEGTVEPPRGNA